MQGLHRLGRTDRTLLWGTAALIALTLGAVTYARMGRGTATVVAGASVCYNSAGVESACLPPPPSDDETVPPSPAGPSTGEPSSAGPPPASTSTAPPPAPLPPVSSSPAVPPPTPSPKQPASRTTSSVPDWAVGVLYRVGVRVSYQGDIYACRQQHTSQADWSPDVTPALWLRVS